MRYNMMTMALGTLGLALYSGCVASAPDQGSAGTADPAPTVDQSIDANLVLRVDVEPGHTVSFYEPSPGRLYLAERMQPGQQFALHDRQAVDAIAAFTALRPEAAVPAALQAAYDRARSMPSGTVGPVTRLAGGGELAAQAPAPAPGVITQALTSSSSAFNFVANDGGCNWGPDFSFCRVNWSNGFFASAGSDSGLCIVDHFAGNGVTIQITDDSAVTATFQAAGTIVQYGLGTPGGNDTRRIDILNASGDSFHVGCRWGF